jgi:hypothetical protein
MPKLFFATVLVLFSIDALSHSGDSTRPGIVRLDPLKVSFKEVGKLPKILKEASGLEFSESKHIWSHNDDGIPALYCIDTLGNLIRAIQLNTKNKGWEDLTQDSKGNFYIGGFGNNANDRKDLRIYIVPNPETITETLVNPKIIDFSYPDQSEFPPHDRKKNFDVDAFFSYEDYLFLITKNRTKPFTGYSKIYRLEQTPGRQIAELIDSIYVGKGQMLDRWITSAALSPDKSTLALLFHDKVWFIRGFTKEKFSTGKVFELSLNHFSHKAGVSFLDDAVMYIVDELEFGLLGGKLYRLDLNPVIQVLNPNN